MSMDSFWKGKKVLVTGHTGFKGSWLSIWLQHLGADVVGYALAPEARPNLFEAASVESGMQSELGDLNDYGRLVRLMKETSPDIVFHLAAQPLVRLSYDQPIATFATNVMGTVHVLEAARQTESIQVVLNITSDKCYDNPGDVIKGFKESDPMGGADPYSASKGCAEIVTSSYLKSYYADNGKSLASARAGNVIGGGDWAKDRIIPDLIRAAQRQEPLYIRYPNAVRPWQHVLDCLHGYLLLVEKLWTNGSEFAGSWNFGPSEQAVVSVSDLVEQGRAGLQKDVRVVYEKSPQLYEAKSLMLNSDKARTQLDWNIKLQVQEAVEWTMEWYNHYFMHDDMRDFTVQQIIRFRDKELSDHVKSTVPIVRRTS
ncbi:CDP-glucose 4,6-dehydratase [Paenibacillus sediminis]|nr:CDP-glucose 4,6-dehydratase [Paenibacillus sediminis]